MTRFYLATEIRIVRSGGHFYSTHTGLSLNMLRPYLDLGEVTIVGRVEDEGEPEETLTLSQEGVSVLPLPTYKGLRGLLSALPQVLRAIARIEARGSVVVARVPEPISILVATHAILHRIPLLTLVVANCYDLIPDTSMARRLVRATWGSTAKTLVRRSTAVVYVTSTWLQSKFPPPEHVPVLNRSSVVINEVTGPRRQKPSKGAQLNVVSMGQMTTMGKGIDALLEAVAAANRQGMEVHLVLLGDGIMRNKLEGMAADLGISHRVVFQGNVTQRHKLFAHLDAADVFISASRAEGLPRAIIEAMTRGLPVITTNAGGSSELVDPSMVVAVDDVPAMVERMHTLASREEVYRELSLQNIEMAKSIRESVSPDRYRMFLASAFQATSRS